MDVGRRRRRGAVEGSVWERRIRLDEVKGGIKALISTSQSEEEEEEEEVESEDPEKFDDQDPTSAPHINDGVCQEDGGVGVGPKPSPGGIGRRKTWKTDCFDLSPIQSARKTRSPLTQSLDEERFKELGLRSPSEKMKPRKVKPFMDNSRNEKNLESRKDFYANGKILGTVHDFEGNEASIDGSRKVSKDCLEDKNEAKPTGLQITRSGKKCEEEKEKVITRKIAFDMVKSTTNVEGDDVDEDHWEEAQDRIEVNVKNISNVSVEKKLENGKERVFPISSRTKSVEESCQTLRHHSRMESCVDLVMWRDVSRSALVFSAGSCLIISSSYLQDSNISLVSVLSYTGLAYLAVLFIFRSLIHREAVRVGETRGFVVEEDEAVRVVKTILPYINEFLLTIKSLFYGDPATTMKMAVALFILAHCGSSITIWKMAKLGFFGAFVVPKLCSSFSSQITESATSWIRRSTALLESFAHKKAIAMGAFALVWILSSAIARIWEAFMAYVAFRYYRLSLTRGPHSITDETVTVAKDEDSTDFNGRRVTR